MKKEEEEEEEEEEEGFSDSLVKNGTHLCIYVKYNLLLIHRFAISENYDTCGYNVIPIFIVFFFFFADLKNFWPYNVIQQINKSIMYTM